MKLFLLDVTKDIDDISDAFIFYLSCIDENGDKIVLQC
jgi:hypothetical protein